MMHKFKVGDLVNYKSNCGNYLRSGASIYSDAVVISENPFICASQTGDMRWEATLEPDSMEKVGTASKDALASAMRRLK